MTVRVGRHERDAGQAQETRGVRGGEEALDEARLVEVEVLRGWLRRNRFFGRPMRRLPLRRPSGAVVTGPRMGMVVPVMMVTTVPVMVVMLIAVMVVVALVRMVMHRQYLAGLSMIALCLPRLPCATIEPRASTTTRTPKSAVMSEVS